MRSLFRLAAIASMLCSLVCGPARALDFGSGPLPVAHEPNAPVALQAGSRIDIKGQIDGTTPVTVVLRIDDGQSVDYASRMNDERTLKPGPFTLSYPVGELHATNGRPLNAADIRRAILFIVGPGSGRVTRFATAGETAAEASASPAATQPIVTVVTAAARSMPVALDLGSGRLPVAYEPGAAAVFAATDQIQIEGTVAGTEPAAIALRIDDASSNGYPARYNDERKIPPGPFRITVGLQGLKTPNGRTLNVQAITRIILFAWEGKPDVTITRFAVARGAAMPEGAHGYALGALDAALPPGFERIGPDDKRLTGRGSIRAIHRPAPDPLLANGLQGVQRLVLPAGGAPRVRVTLWSEDPGEWELLPHPFNQRITVNGREVVNDRRSADAWITTRYLRGAAIEHTAADDAWTAYGAKRGKAASIDVDGRDSVVIEMSGTALDAYFLNAVLIEPIGPNMAATTLAPGQAFAQAERAAWYRNTFPVSPPPGAQSDGTISVPFIEPAGAPAAPLALRAAPGTGVGFKLAITTDALIEHPQVTLAAPRRAGVTLGARLWTAQYKLDRDASILRLKDNRLLANGSALPLRPEIPRGMELWIDVPKGAPPGVYTGSLTLGAIGRLASQRSIPISITVLPVALPAAAKPAGFYLARAPHLSYFNGLTLERERQVQCDLDLLGGFGLANTAPPIGGLTSYGLRVFGADMRRAAASGVAPGWLLYNPLTLTARDLGPEKAAALAARAEAMIRAQRLPEPLWSAADEPGNPDQANFDLAAWIKMLRSGTPGIKLAGHLNTPTDIKYAPLFDTVIVNDGFGIDVSQLQQLRDAGRHVWIYNTFTHRQTAGLWLWRSAAERYVQWHARLPTADPFDPIDGREADAQMIYPSATVCPAQPDIHRDLLRMAEGVVDQRWLLWLDAQSTTPARLLASEIRANLPGPYTDAGNRSRASLETLRNRIMDLVAP